MNVLHRSKMPASRSSSRNSRVPCSVPIVSDDYLQKTVTPGSRSVSRQPSIDGLSVKGRVGRQAAGVRRWEGDRGTPSEWDGLKRVSFADLSSARRVTVYRTPRSSTDGYLIELMTGPRTLVPQRRMLGPSLRPRALPTRSIVPPHPRLSRLQRTDHELHLAIGHRHAVFDYIGQRLRR